MSRTRAVARIPLLVCVLLLAVSCEVDKTPASIELDPTALNLEVGESAKVKATVRNKRGVVLTPVIAWSSDAASIASVDASGNVTGNAPGKATITAKVDAISATVAVTVRDAVAATVAIEPASVSLRRGELRQLSASVKNAAGEVIPDAPVSWASKAPSIASTDGSGKVTALAAGETEVTATSGGKSASAAVKVLTDSVSLPPAVDSLSPAMGVPGTVVTIRGSRFGGSQGSSSVSFGPAAVPGSDVVSWSDTELAVKVPASAAPGEAAVTVTVDGQASNTDKKFTVFPAVASLEWSPAPPARLVKGRTATAGVITKDAAGNVLTGRTVTWSSSPGTILAVSSAGVLTGVEIGDGRVTARAEGASLSADVKVYQPPTVTTVTPASGPSFARVRVQGLAFGLTQADSAVKLVPESGDAVVAEVLSWSDTAVEVRVPADTPLGGYRVVVTVGGGDSNNDKMFTVTNGPYILSVSPRTAVQGSKVMLTISGTNLATCPVALNRNGSPDSNITVDNAGKVVDRFGAPGLPDELRVNIDTAATASLGDYAVSCGASTTQVNDDNRFTLSPKEGSVLNAAGSGTSGAGSDGPASTAQFNEPGGLALGASGELYIADTGNNRVRVLNPTSNPLVVAGVTVPAGHVATIAGGGGVAGNTDAGYAGDGGAARQSKLNAPVGLAYDKRGLLFVADSGNNCIRAINVGGAAVMLPAGELIAGNIARVAGAGGSPGYFGDGGPALPSSRFFGPMGVAVDASGLLYVADSSNNRLRVVNTSLSDVTNGLGTFASGHVALVAGSSAGYAGDGTAISSGTLLSNPTGLALDDAGRLFISDTNNNRIRVLNTSMGALRMPGTAPAAPWTTSDAGVIRLAAGAGGTAAFASEGCGMCIIEAKFASPAGLATGPLGELYIADENNNRVRHAVTGDGPLFRAGAYTHALGIRTLHGDGTTAKVFGAKAVAYAARTGTLYVANTLRHRIERVVVGYARDPFSGELGAWPADFTSGNATLDVDTGVLSYTGASGPVERRFGDVGGVFSFRGKVRLFPGTVLTVTGVRPALFASTGEMQIDGTLQVTNGRLLGGMGLGTHWGTGSGHAVDGVDGGGCDYWSRSGGKAYGNAQLLPITAGSGDHAGGALILSAGVPGTPANLKVAGAVQATVDNIGTPANCAWGGGNAHSGGGIRLVATGSVQVSGGLAASAGYNSCTCYCSATCLGPTRTGSAGRIRLEAPVVTTSATYSPPASIEQAEPAPLPWL